MAHPTHRVCPGVVGGGGGVQLGPPAPGVARCLEICKGVTRQNSSAVNASKDYV